MAYHVKLGTIQIPSSHGTHRGHTEQQYVGRYSRGPFRPLGAENASHFVHHQDALKVAEEFDGVAVEGTAPTVIRPYASRVQ